MHSLGRSPCYRLWHKYVAGIGMHESYSLFNRGYLIDPNRPGMHLKLIKFLLKLRAPRLIYVSCNPATCARDLDYLCHDVVEQNIKGCYKLKSVQPVDMFPHTPHIECICLLELE
ncbi:hypothetical protein GIB67_010258 [Kingdonia uniflora]|uniref:RNA methyltransferase n=1 Tax=Kingdonia uniflora TaxID=39325 RepID=A0A7J7NBR1_9MAGN|nr:hypothetical protein GIB67_010258 [Kingdonia uniflora]